MQAICAIMLTFIDQLKMLLCAFVTMAQII